MGTVKIFLPCCTKEDVLDGERKLRHDVNVKIEVPATNTKVLLQQKFLVFDEIEILPI